jgi:ribosomal protein S18 acetylase RimI-like enzyme
VIESTVFRLATPADLDVVTAITDAAYAHYVPRLGRKPQPMTTDYAPMIAAGQVWLLDLAAQPVGLIILIDKDDHLLIYSVALRPEYQGRGLGRKLLAYAEQQTRAADYNLVRLYTNSLMTENIARYIHVGYGETGRDPLNESSSIVYMEKHL